MPRTFDFVPKDDAKTRNGAEAKVFGTPLADAQEYGNLVGDIAGDAKIRVVFNQPFSKMVDLCPITIMAESSLHRTTVRLAKNIIDYSECKVFKTREGTGLKIFELVAKTAQRLKFTNIQAEGRKCNSQTKPELNSWGHVTYPGYGFDQKLPDNLRNKLMKSIAEKFTHALPLNDDPEGRKEWKKSGDTLGKLLFDLTAESPSWKRLEKAIAEQAAKEAAKAAHSAAAQQPAPMAQEVPAQTAAPAPKSAS